MTIYRTQVRIIADILEAARSGGLGYEGVGVTLLLRKANLSYARLTKILKELISSGLIEEIDSDKANKYRISSRGLEYLQVYSKFEEFATTFGLRL